MQLLYGNDGINYRTIDKSAEMSDNIVKSILNTYSKYEFVSNPKAYTDGYEPEAITYVSSDLERQFQNDQLVICKAGRMRRFSAASFYFHCLVREVPEDFYDKQFFEIFNYHFVDDYDVGQYGKGKIDQYSFQSEIRIEKALTNDQLIVILAKFMANEDEGKKTKILVDVTGDEYNRRSREILATVYTYLPPKMRKSYGFKTYCQDGTKLPARVSFALFNSDETKNISECITLQETAEDIKRSVKKEYIQYATYLVEELDDAGREEHFKVLARLEKNGRLAINDCVLYYSKLKKWEKGTQEQLLPEWIQYVDQNSFLKGPLYEILLKIIVDKVDNEYYNDYLFKDVLELYKESIYALSSTAMKTIRFVDCLEEIYIEPERFHEWYRSQWIKKIEENADLTPGEFRELCDTEIKTLQAINIQSPELNDLLATEIQNLQKKLNECDEKQAEQEERELEEAGAQIKNLEKATLEKFCETAAVIWNNLSFEKNREAVKYTIEEWVDANIQKKFESLKELNDYLATFEELKNKISAKKYEKYMDLFSNEKKRLEEIEKARCFVIAKGEVLESYREFVSCVSKGILGETTGVQIRIGETEKTIAVRNLKGIFEFILQPNEKNLISSGWRDTILKEGNIFTAEHLPYLLDSSVGTEQVLEIIHYYLDSEDKETVQVSGRYVGYLLEEKYAKKKKEIISKVRREAEGERQENEEWDALAEELGRGKSFKEKGSKNHPSSEPQKPEPEKGDSIKGAVLGFKKFFGGGKNNG